MKKSLMFSLLTLFSIGLMGQGLFKPVAPFPTIKPKYVGGAAMVENPKTLKMEFRLDATISLAEVVWHKDTKYFETISTLGAGPAIGMQWYRPKSELDPTPVNVFGVSAGALLGNQFKAIVQLNVWQYFRFGMTFTPNSQVNIGKLGLFFGSGITF
jgi:hypothetical protein